MLTLKHTYSYLGQAKVVEYGPLDLVYKVDNPI